MSYGVILRTAFDIARRHRYLWFFGLFAGGGAGFNVPTNFSVDGFHQGDGRGQRNPIAGELSQIDPAVIVGVVVAALLLGLLVLALYLVAQGALTESVAAIDRGGQRRFRSAWQAGARHFWRVLGWAALLFVIGVGIVLVFGAPLAGVTIAVFAVTEATGARVAVVVLVALLALAAIVLLLIPLAIVGQLSLRELVVQEERPVAALRRGYRMFRGNLGPSLLVWLIQLGVSLGGAIALVLVLLIVGIVLFLPTLGLAVADLGAAAIVTGVVAGLNLLALSLVAFGALGTFTHAVWTLAYMRLRPQAEQAPA